LFKVIFFLCLFSTLASGLSLDSLYQLAQPGEGYDKLLVLDSFQVYEGGFSSDNGKKSCIHGQGAIIDLSNGAIQKISVQGIGTVLDIDRCVIINGSAGSSALDYSDSASGKLNHLTMVDNYDGIRFWCGESLTLKNSIVVNTAHYGVMTIDSSMSFFSISYNDCWNNQYGNYICWFSSC